MHVLSLVLFTYLTVDSASFSNVQSTVGFAPLALRVFTSFLAASRSAMNCGSACSLATAAAANSEVF